jgi:Arc/MetJ-type ribon-helix-helix transcriptional regulator
MTDERVTVTLPRDMVKDIDRHERNRSKFVREAVRNELTRRKREALLRSLANPHGESEEMADLGLETWMSEADGTGRGALDVAGGRGLRWRPGQGWEETGP